MRLKRMQNQEWLMGIVPIAASRSLRLMTARRWPVSRSGL